MTPSDRRAEPLEGSTGGENSVFSAPALYDAEYRSWKRDAGFYRRNADELLGGPAEILELACGTGRVTRELVKGGHRVVALDRSAPMLRRAQARRMRLSRAARARIHLARADMRSFRIGRRFPLIICAFNSLEHLYSDRDVNACLHSVRDHLASDGVFLFDVHNPDPRILGYRPSKLWGVKTFKAEDGTWLRRGLRSHYDRVTQIHRVVASYQPLASDRKTPAGPAFRREISQRQFWPRELEATVREAGFQIALRLGEFDNTVFDGDSPSQILFCQPSPPPDQRTAETTRPGAGSASVRGPR